jgi:hypothetical protein
MKRLYLVILTLLGLANVTIAQEQGNDGDWAFLREHLTGWHEQFRGERTKTKINSFRFLPEIAAEAIRADTILVYEGLPHDTWEPNSRKIEIRRNKTVKVSGFSFYDGPQSLRAHDLGELHRLLTGATGLQPYTGPKMGGGFNPDYALQFTSGKDTCTLLLCFTEGDAILTHGKSTVYCSTRWGWEDFLLPYKSKRPPREQRKVEQPGAGQPATKPADKTPGKGQPSTPTPKDGPR